MLKFKKLEKRFLQDTIGRTDVKKWEMVSSAGIYQGTQKLWEAYDIKQPQILVGYNSNEIDVEKFERGYVPLGTKDILTVKKIHERTRQGRLSAVNTLTSMLARRFTFFIAYQMKPENFSTKFSFCEPETCTEENFYNFAATNCQVEALGEVSSRTIERQEDFYNALRHRQALDVILKEIEIKARQNQKNVGKGRKKAKRLAEMSSSRRMAEEKRGERREQTRRRMADKWFKHAIRGTTLCSVADEFEKQGNFPQLIRTAFKPDEKHVNYFKEFFNQYVPFECRMILMGGYLLSKGKARKEMLKLRV